MPNIRYRSWTSASSGRRLPKRNARWTMRKSARPARQFSLIKLSVKIVYDKKIAEEKYSGKSEGELYQILWEKVKEINKTFPPYKYIKNMILTDEELIKTTTQKVKRNEEIKRILGR